MKPLVTVLALLLALAAAACGGEATSGSASSTSAKDAPDARAEVERIVADLEPSLERLNDALGAARPGSRQGTLDVYRAAENAADPLDDAEVALNDVDPATDEDEQLVDSVAEAVGRLSNLDDALLDSEPQLTRIEDAAIAVDHALAAVDGVDLPRVDAANFIGVLRSVPPGEIEGPVDEPAEAPGDDAAAAPPEDAGFRVHDTEAFRAKLPSGPGWGAPKDSEPTRGKLFRTEVRHEDGTFVIVDYTPFEEATFGGRYESRDSTGRMADGASATRYVFRGGDVADCRRHRCVDYVLNSGSGVDGFAVLAGGPDFGKADTAAQRVSDSLTPLGRGG